MKKQQLQKAIPFLLAAFLAALAPWYHRVYIAWNPGLYVVAFLAMTVVMAALSFSVFRQWKKTLLSTGVFAVAILFGVSFLINNVIGNESLNRPAAAVALSLAAAQVLALLWKPWRALGGKAKLAAGIAIPLLVAASASAILFKDTWGAREYLMLLERAELFGNRVQDSLPQTAAHDMVIGHFARERGDGKAPKGLVIGYDGARADALALTAGDPRSAVQALKAQGGWIYSMYCGGDAPRWQKTSTQPGWTNLLTGRWANERGGGGHGVRNNGVVKAPGAPGLIFNNLFDQGLAAQAAFVVAWDEYFDYPGAVWYHDKAYAEEKGYNIRWVNLAHDGDIVLFEAGLEEIRDPGNDFIMVTLDACDYAGHGYGFDITKPEYAQAFIASEHYAFELIQAVKARPTYAGEDWLIIVTSDHGGAGTGHGGQDAQSRQIFVAANQEMLHSAQNP